MTSSSLRLRVHRNSSSTLVKSNIKEDE